MLVVDLDPLDATDKGNSRGQFAWTRCQKLKLAFGGVDLGSATQRDIRFGAFCETGL
jgi:hypothetical protein